MATVHRFENVGRLPHVKWPGDSIIDFHKRFAAYYAAWLIFEVMIGSLTSFMAVLMGVPTKWLDRIIEPRDVLLICVALLATRLGELLLSGQHRRTTALYNTVMASYMIFIVFGVALASTARISELTGHVVGHVPPWWLAITYAILATALVSVALAYRVIEEENGETHHIQGVGLLAADTPKDDEDCSEPAVQARTWPLIAVGIAIGVRLGSNHRQRGS